MADKVEGPVKAPAFQTLPTPTDPVPNTPQPGPHDPAPPAHPDTIEGGGVPANLQTPPRTPPARPITEQEQHDGVNATIIAEDGTVQRISNRKDPEPETIDNATGKHVDKSGGPFKPANDSVATETQPVAEAPFKIPEANKNPVVTEPIKK